MESPHSRRAHGYLMYRNCFYHVSLVTCPDLNIKVVQSAFHWLSDAISVEMYLTFMERQVEKGSGRFLSSTHGNMLPSCKVMKMFLCFEQWNIFRNEDRQKVHGEMGLELLLKEWQTALLGAATVCAGWCIDAAVQILPTGPSVHPWHCEWGLVLVFSNTLLNSGITVTTL